MDLALAFSRFALGVAICALVLTLSATRSFDRPSSGRRKSVMALGTLALGMALFALFFGLVAACDRL